MQLQPHQTTPGPPPEGVVQVANGDHPTSQETTPSEWLTFKLGGEEYGIDILSVQEIRSLEKPTRMANMPAFVLGVPNLRGVIVPVLDMRVKFNSDRVEYGDLSCASC